MDSRTYPFYTFGDGQKVQATVHFDPRKKDEAQGIAILFHGGGFVVGSKDTIPEAQISALAELGFISVAPNYRLCPHVSLWDGPLADASNVYFWSREKLPGVLKSDVGLTVHPDQIVAIGYSAGGLLALHLGTLSPPPRAIADFYGGKLLSDPSWSLPLPALSRLPDFDPSFLRNLFDEPLITFTTRAMERESAEEAEKHGGAPRPDFSRPRNAWLADHMKKGTHLAACVQDGNYERCDPVKSFGKGFPPTVFVHGTTDDLIEARISEQAFKVLEEKGGVGKLLLAEGLPHGFDIGAKTGDEAFEKYVKPALEFLAKHAQG